MKLLSSLLTALLSPAILLALVPLLRLALENFFERVFRNSTKESLDKAARPENGIIAVREAVANDGVRVALAQYIENAADLERFFETCFFSSLSLLVWLLTEAKERYEMIFVGVFFFVIVVALLVVGIKTLKESYEPGRRDVAKWPRRFSQFLTVVIVLVEVILKLTGHEA